MNRPQKPQIYTRVASKKCFFICFFFFCMLPRYPSLAMALVIIWLYPAFISLFVGSNCTKKIYNMKKKMKTKNNCGVIFEPNKIIFKCFMQRVGVYVWRSNICFYVLLYYGMKKEYSI